MRKKICIRAEGGSKIGMGHVMRMLELANVLRDKMDVFFASKYDINFTEEYGAGIRAIEAAGFSIIKLSKNDFFNELALVEADAILTDSYDVSVEYFDYVNGHFPVSIYVDDENIMKCSYFDVDVLVNPNPYADRLEYCVPEKTQKLLGSRFLILRDEFIGKPQKIFSKNIENVMVTVGGSDNANLTETIIQQLLPRHYNLRIIVGVAFTHTEKLERYCSDKVELCYNANMSECMEWCDAAITSCGATVYEMAAMGVPALGLAVVDNQEMCLDYMDENGLVLRSTPRTVGQDIIRLTQNKRRRISENGRLVIDGRGKHRIADAIFCRLKCGK